MSKERKDNEIESLREEIKELKDKLENVIQKVDTLVENFSFLTRSVRGGEAVIDLTREEIIKFLKDKPEGATAREISEKLGMSRSHTSAILNELYRTGYLKKGRFRREIKYFLKEE